MLYARRKRQDELTRREAAGEDLWKPDLGAPGRVRLAHLVTVICDETRDRADVYGQARGLVIRELGLESLAGLSGAGSDVQLAIRKSDIDLVASVLEALDWVLRSDAPDFVEVYREATALILAEHRAAFDFIDGQMVPFESREMHVAVVEPTLRLLAGRADWDGVELAYRNALHEIGTDPADAVTDAGTALQVALEQLGCGGNALGPLGRSAVGMGILSGHDQKLVDWVAADRSQSGDTHNADPVTRDDAWFAVHVVGALLLRLAGETPRG